MNQVSRPTRQTQKRNANNASSIENGVTWWVMSMIRTSGTIPIITALQMATASFAVPNSVMKTIVERAAAAAYERHRNKECE
jgi:hypothetical protein